MYQVLKMLHIVCECLIRRIQIYPRGFEEERDESLSVYLLPEGFINNGSPNTKTFAKFKLRVLDQVNRNHVEKTCMDVSFFFFSLIFEYYFV